ncbi:MAG: biotin/lipoyl-containing protein [Planctomycetaceae bacterium]
MLEAMKMQTIIAAERDGTIADIHIHTGTQVESGDLLMTMS